MQSEQFEQQPIDFTVKPEPIKLTPAQKQVYDFIASHPTRHLTSWEIHLELRRDYNILMAPESAGRYCRSLRGSGLIVSRKRLNENGKSYSEFTFHEIGR
jgi:Fe2+ or Zn2+ uptake regulation protein